MISEPQFDFRSLLTRLDQDTKATICLPQDPEYSNLLKRHSDRNVKPAGAIFLPTTAQDISAAIKFVKEHNIDLAVVCGGHSGSDCSSSNGGLVIDLRRMKNVTVDTIKKTLTCESGCLAKDVDLVAAKYGLAFVGPIVNHVGIGGFTLGGGHSYLSGLYGMAVDNALSVEMVLASGEIVTASNEENQDLFWAIRGAGANFGVVTKFTYRAHDQKNKIYAGFLFFHPTASNISSILDFCNSHFTSEQDDGRTVFLPTIGCAPPELKDPVVVVLTVHNGSEEEGSRLLKPLLDLNPIVNTMKVMPYEETGELINELVPHGDRKVTRGFTYTLPLKATTFMDALDSFKNLIEEFSDDPKTRQSFIIFKYISNRKTTEANKGCYANCGGYFNGIIHPRWTIPENDEGVMNWAKGIDDIISLKNGVVMEDGRRPTYANYDDLRHSSRDLFGDNYPRLVELKTKYDPTNLFNKWHSLVPKSL